MGSRCSSCCGGGDEERSEEGDDEYRPQQQEGARRGQRGQQQRLFLQSNGRSRRRDSRANSNSSSTIGLHSPGSATVQASVPRVIIDKMVLETLNAIRTLVDNEQDPPEAMVYLHELSETESGWLDVTQSLVDVIPIKDPLGPANITLLLDDSPIPAKETIFKLYDNLGITSSSNSAASRVRAENRDRNVGIVLGCLAEKMAGPRAMTIFTNDVFNYLVDNLDPSRHPSVILFSVLALEKFAATAENKLTIAKGLAERSSLGGPNPLCLLEDLWVGDEKDLAKRQVGFCAQWCLDNLFIQDGRPFSYMTEDTAGTEVMLNANDVSEYLKIAPSGLEARCDAFSFESVRCTFQVDSGVWYYELEVVTEGIMQVGWATKESKFLNHDGYGIGDDEHSVAFDGCRQLVWHHAGSQSIAHQVERWKAGDIVGSLLDLNKKKLTFFHNGLAISPIYDFFAHNESGFFAAASFMSFQQCRFNFGSRPFKFPPDDVEFRSFNSEGSLSDEQRMILPRHMRLQLQLGRNCSREESACTICVDNAADTVLRPCGHGGFCADCVGQLEASGGKCPMCRAKMTSHEKMAPEEDQ